MARLCLSAFARVATGFLRVYRQRRPLCHSAFVRVATPSYSGSSSPLVFATAHSCGLRLDVNAACVCGQSLPQRIRAGCDAFRGKLPKGANLCHSAFARVATQQTHQCLQFRHALPQRIRAGCDVLKRLHRVHGRSLPQRIRAGCDDIAFYVGKTHWLCHSAFVRVATVLNSDCDYLEVFATAHSCGLRHCHGYNISRRRSFATAHSCGLRRIGIKRQYYTYAVFATAHSCGLRHAIDTFFVSSDIFATAHSCGLRRLPHTEYGRMRILCHSAFVRVATRCGLKKRGDADLCHSAFVRVATLLNQKKLWCGFFATAHSCGLRQATVLTQ